MKKLTMDELNRISVGQYKQAEKTPIVVVLDNVRSMNNIGSVFRTADAFRIENIYLCGITATPPHRDIHKTALGAEDSVDWEYFENTLDCVKRLRADDCKIFSVEQVEGSVKLNAFTPEKDGKIAVIFGNEIDGVAQEVVDACDGCIEIPQFGTKHSLNVSVTAGIVLWDLFSKMKL
jgi:tRNA G18 (ribose-2'-O)-methylase SpoU